MMELRCISSGSTGNAYLLIDDRHMLLLDAGVSWRDIQIACGFDVYGIDACLVTHSHLDHSRNVSKVDAYGIQCWTGQNAYQPILDATGCITTVLSERKWNHIGHWSIIPLEVHHDVPCYGFIVGCPTGDKLAYFTDFSYIGTNGKRKTLKSMNINHFLIAVNYSAEPDENTENSAHIYGGHSSLKTVKSFLEASATDECRSIIACHLSDKNSDERQILTELRSIVPETVLVGIADKGRTFKL